METNNNKNTRARYKNKLQRMFTESDNSTNLDSSYISLLTIGDSVYVALHKYVNHARECV